MATLTTSWQSFASASFSTGSSNVNFYLEARYTSQSTANNTTNVQTRLRSDLTSGYISGAGYKFTCTYASTVSGSGVWSFGDEVITSGSATVTHNNDGTKTLSLSATAYNKYWNFTKNLSASVSIPKIDRIATVTSGTDFNDETNPKITFTNPANYQLVPYINFYQNGSLVIHIERPKGSYISPYIWELTEQERQDIRDTLTTISSQNVIEGLFTYNGNSNIGASSVIRRFTFINANPTFDASYLDTNSTTTAITGDNQLIIQNHSTLQINGTNLSAKKSATLSSIVASINGVNYNGTISGTTATFSIGALNISNNINATITLTDSRGLTAVNTLPITILEYSQPSAIISIARENNFYSTTNIKVEANYSSLDSHNVITIKTRYKKTTDANYGAYVTLTDGVTSQLTLDNNYQWDVQVLLQDSISSTTYNLTVDKGIPIVFFDRTLRSMGVNCFPIQSNTLELNNVDLARNIMTMYLQTNFKLSANNTAFDVTGFAQGVTVGNKLTFSNNRIYIGSGVSKVKVCYSAKIQSVNTTRTFVYLSQNGNHISQEGWWPGASGQQSTVGVTSRVLNVNEGDYFNLRCYGTANTLIMGKENAPFVFTTLTVEVVE